MAKESGSSSGGGAAGAIATAVASVVESVFGFLSEKQRTKQSYQNILRDTLPKYRNFSLQENAEHFRLVAILGVVAIIIILAAAITKIKK